MSSNGLRERPVARWALWSGIAGALAVAAALIYEVQRGLRLEAAVREVLAMDVAELDRAYRDSSWKSDRYFLGAMAQNKSARAAVLAQIAARDDPELYQPMDSLWDVMGANREGLAVMRLVAVHPNTDAATLARLAARADAAYLLRDVLANPKTPPAVLERHFDSTDYLVESGLARNPKTPQRVLERLSRSPNLHTRMNLAGNLATPHEILERLAQDPDAGLARNAKQAIERRRAGNQPTSGAR